MNAFQNSEFIQTQVVNHIGFIILDRPKALNSLSLAMVRSLTHYLRLWQNDEDVKAICIHSSSEKAFCAGGDIRFFYDCTLQTPQGGSALLEDFFTEEYALNHLIHYYPKPYIALMDGVIMGGGMGIAQAGKNRMRIVTERTKMAMPEVNIGLFPDVGGSYFLNRTPGYMGRFLGVTGEVIHATDAIYAGLADIYIPSQSLPDFFQHIQTQAFHDISAHIRAFAENFQDECPDSLSYLAQQRAIIDDCFSQNKVNDIIQRLQNYASSEFAKKTLHTMHKRSPLMMSVTLSQLKRTQTLSLADCLRLERTMVRHCFSYSEIVEGVRALVIEKDNQPQWKPPYLHEVSDEMVEHYFKEIWPDYAHPLAHL